MVRIPTVVVRAEGTTSDMTSPGAENVFEDDPVGGGRSVKLSCRGRSRRKSFSGKYISIL